MSMPLSSVNRVLFFFVLLTVLLYFGRPILVPFSFAILFSMLMTPLCKYLDRRGWSRVFSSLLCVFIVLVIFLGMIFIMVAQVSSFAGELNQVEKGTNELILHIKHFVQKRFDIPVEEQTAFLQKQAQELGQNLRGYITGVLRSSVQLAAGLIITLVFTFLLLFHREKYFRFFLHFAGGGSEAEKKKMLYSIGSVAQQYLVGRAISILILFVLYAVALVVIGIKSALLLAAVAALFNIIPYLGPILAALFPFLVALVTEESYQPAIWVLVTFCLFQAFDNYWVTPYFLGGEVSLTALATIVSMICGGFLWGVAGMILFIPMFSIMKIIFDHVPGLRHYGELIGDSGGRPSEKARQWLRKVFGKKNNLTKTNPPA